MLPNGLSSEPRKFIRLTKPPIAVLRLEGIIIAIYKDDLIIFVETYEECLTGSNKTIKIFLRLGFLVHPDKSIFLLTQKITYLGFIYDSVNMSLSVTDDKKDKIQKSCNSYLEKESLKIREVTSLIGTLTATFPGNKLGPLYYRALDKSKTYALKNSKGNFECRVTLLNNALLDLKCWRDNIIFVSRSLQYPPISKVIYTDASNIGWGASCEGMSTRGLWLLEKYSGI